LKIINRAKTIATQQVPFIDTSNYLVSKISEIDTQLNETNFFSLFNLTRDTSKEELLSLYEKTGLTFTTDIPKLKNGNVSTLFFAILPDCSNPHTDVLKQLDIAQKLVQLYSDNFYAVRSSSDILTAFYKRRIGSATHIVGGHSIGASFSENLKEYYSLGIRSISIASELCTNNWAQSWKEVSTFGLSKQGEKIIAEMNKLGMIIDLSQCSTKTMTSVLSSSFAPVVITQSALRYVSNIFNIDHP